MWWVCHLIDQTDVKWLLYKLLSSARILSGGGGGGAGVRTPKKITKNIGFLSNACPDPLKNHKATLYQASIYCRDIISTPAKRHLNGVSLAGR